MIRPQNSFPTRPRPQPQYQPIRAPKNKRKKLFTDSVSVNKKYLTDTLSVNKKYLTDSVFPIEKKHVKGGGIQYGGLLQISRGGSLIFSFGISPFHYQKEVSMWGICEVFLFTDSVSVRYFLFTDTICEVLFIHRYTICE